MLPLFSPFHQSFSENQETKWKRKLQFPCSIFFSFFYKLTPLSQSEDFHCLSTLSTDSLHAPFLLLFPPSPFPSFLWLENQCDASYIKNCKVWKTSAKIGQTASILSRTVHWLMSVAGHYLSRRRKFTLSSLSCQCCTQKKKNWTGIYFHSHRPVT